MSSPSIPDHYATLGVPRSAPHGDIRAAYRQRMRAVHPDVAGDDAAATARAREVNIAWAVLRDPTARAAYDRQRATAHRSQVTESPSRSMPSDGMTWQTGGVPLVTIDQLREAAARESAYAEVFRAQSEAFAAASLRIGLLVVLVGALLLAMITAR